MSDERVQNLIPFVHVTDVQRSIASYGLLGFELKDAYEHEGELNWAALESRDAQLMLARASLPIERDKQAVLFYLYADDLQALREHLLANGVVVGEIRDGSPGPAREMGLDDTASCRSGSRRSWVGSRWARCCRRSSESAATRTRALLV